MKTSELTGAALDWAVAYCEGINITFGVHGPSGQWEMYSTNWAQGGPIIERAEIDIIMVQRDLHTWVAEIYETPTGYKRYQATTPLTAAMRCYVASKLGDEVAVPMELT